MKNLDIFFTIHFTFCTEMCGFGIRMNSLITFCLPLKPFPFCKTVIIGIGIEYFSYFYLNIKKDSNVLMYLNINNITEHK